MAETRTQTTEELEAVFPTLPRLLKDYTPEQADACIEWLSRLGLPELRTRQSLMNQQIEVAYAAATKPFPAPHALEALQNCQDMADQLVAAVGRWLDRKNAD